MLSVDVSMFVCNLQGSRSFCTKVALYLLMMHVLSASNLKLQQVIVLQ